jgi:hypothetical protein
MLFTFRAVHLLAHFFQALLFKEAVGHEPAKRLVCIFSEGQ